MQNVPKGSRPTTRPTLIYSTTATVLQYYYYLWCRPEDTHKGKQASYQADLNLVYYSFEEAKVSLADICGKCEVIYSEEVLDSRSKLDEYFRSGPDRFYFTEV